MLEPRRAWGFQAELPGGLNKDRVAAVHLQALTARNRLVLVCCFGFGFIFRKNVKRHLILRIVLDIGK